MGSYLTFVQLATNSLKQKEITTNEGQVQIPEITQSLDELAREGAKRMIAAALEKGVGSRKAGLAMAFKLLLAAEKRWRKINAPHLVALVQAGVKFPGGQQKLTQVREK